MLCSLLSAGIWIALATFLELPVSTTHSIVGAIIGFSMVAAGANSVIWTAPPSNGSPFPGGVVAIVLAWFITPAMAAVVAGLMFTFTKVVVLKAKNPFRTSLFLFPLYTFITIWIITFFVIQKGVNGWMKVKTYNAPGFCPPGASTNMSSTKNYKTDASGNVISVTNCAIQDGTNAWISAVTAAVCTVGVTIGLKLVVKLVNRDMAAIEAAEAAKVAAVDADAAGTVENGESKDKDGAVGAHPANRTPASLQGVRRSKVWTALTHGANVDIHEVTEIDEKIKAMHAEAEVFDRKTELSFKYLQVLTACANSFAHGANDVANAIGSMAAVYSIWECGCAAPTANVPIWMFVLGGAGLVLGLATYGYNIMRALGVKMTKLTNSRGYCAELTAAIIVIIASRYGFPVSTTQVITGAITGIGITEVISAKMRGERHAAGRFNWLLLLKFFCGWVATLVVAGLTCAAFTAQGIYAPSKVMSNARAEFNAAFNVTNVGMAQTLILAGNVTNPTPAQAQALTWGQTLANATKAWSSTTNITLLETNVPLAIFQQGTWFLGNSTQAGVFPNGTAYYMPAMPLSTDGDFGVYWD